MLHLRRVRETFPHRRAPEREIRRIAELLGMMRHRLPLHHQQKLLRMLDLMVQFQFMKSGRARKNRPAGLHPGDELRFHPWLHLDLGTFGNHQASTVR